jgi:hypothetical protein
MKRILVLLSVVALMVVMLAMPVLADTSGDQRGPGNQGPPAETGDFDHTHGSVVNPKSGTHPGACVDHYGGGNSGGTTGRGCS